jgi:GT2 family glycosyltransferase/glycosyltransferase involved in cell wall biosynthesis
MCSSIVYLGRVDSNLGLAGLGTDSPGGGNVGLPADLTHELEWTQARCSKLERWLEEAELESGRAARETQQLRYALRRAERRHRKERDEAERLRSILCELVEALRHGDPAPLDRALGVLGQGEIDSRVRAHLRRVAIAAGPVLAHRDRKIVFPEERSRARFFRDYTSIHRPWPGVESVDPAGAALPPRGGTVLRPSGAAQVDVVVCVHDAPDDARACLWSLTAHGTYPLHLILVDDGSADPTRRFLEHVAVRHPQIELIRHDGPLHGYARAANIGLRASTADWVVLLNSDTIVTSQWLENLIGWTAAHRRVGLVGPLSNAATHQSVPEKRDRTGWAVNELPPWATAEVMGFVVARLSERVRPRWPFINGFCMAIRRPVIEAVGYLDEKEFGAGYAEENDYCIRARDAGFEAVVADDAYVYHGKSRSYGGSQRNQLAREQFQKLMAKHGRARIDIEAAEVEDRMELDTLRRELRSLATPGQITDAFPRLIPAPLRIGFLLPNMAPGGSGGVHSVYQEVVGLRRLGVPAKVFISEGALDAARAAYVDVDEVFQPYRTEAELAQISKPHEVLVATHFSSMRLLSRLRARRPNFLPAYYAQDYEPFFFCNSIGPERDEAAASYTLIEDAFVFAKTHWLCNVISERHSICVAKVEPSLDRGLYNPQGRPPPETSVRVTAMVRPRTWRRQPLTTLRMLERLQDSFGDDVQCVSFGCDDESLKRLLDGGKSTVRHLGIIGREAVADLHRNTDIFLDFSVFQALGRTAFEAMACGCVAVLTRVGGVEEFAHDGSGALLVDPADEEEAYRLLCGLITDRSRLQSMQADAMHVAPELSVIRAVLSEYVSFERAHEARGLPRLDDGGRPEADWWEPHSHW